MGRRGRGRVEKVRVGDAVAKDARAAERIEVREAAVRVDREGVGYFSERKAAGGAKRGGRGRTRGVVKSREALTEL